MLSRAIDIFLSQDILNGSYHDIQRMLLLFEFGNRLGCLRKSHYSARAHDNNDIIFRNRRQKQFFIIWCEGNYIFIWF